LAISAVQPVRCSVLSFGVLVIAVGGDRVVRARVGLLPAYAGPFGAVKSGRKEAEPECRICDREQREADVLSWRFGRGRGVVVESQRGVLCRGGANGAGHGLSCLNCSAIAD